MKFIFNEVHHEVELCSKHAQQSNENECDEVIAETFVEDEYSLQAAGLLCAALVYSLNLNQICLAQGWCEHRSSFGERRAICAAERNSKHERATASWPERTIHVAAAPASRATSPFDRDKIERRQ